jgi:uroporphyrinogen decarboxylase
MNTNFKSVITNERFSNAIHRIPQNIPPVWFMRQAGRYHAHYRKLREKHSFIDLCKIPELASEVALGPVLEFGYDVSILFSDLLFPLEAMGMGLKYEPGPILSKRIETLEDVNNLYSVDKSLEGVQFQKKALEYTREVLPKHVSLIGFVGGPWTLFTYANSGKHDGNLSKPKSNIKLIEAFYNKLLPLLRENIKLQLDSGAEVVMIFDTAAGDLAPLQFNEYVTKVLEPIINEFPKRIGYYAKAGTRDQLYSINSIQNLAGFGLDHRFQMESILKEGFANGFVQGNFDQSLFFLPTEDFKKALKNYLAPIKELSTEQRAGWVSALGHGVLPLTPEDHVKFMVEHIRETFQ